MNSSIVCPSTFGSSLNHDPANAGQSCDQNNLDSSPLCTHIGSFYPGTSGRAKAGANGTIVFGINDHGQVVGVYENPDGTFHGFLRNP